MPATATPVPPTATPESTLRPRSEWTEANPATREEIEAELEKYRGKSFVFASWGGAYQAAQRQAYIIPFEAKFGIDVLEESPPSVAKVRAQVETNNITWNVVDAGSDLMFLLIKSDSLEPLDYSVIDMRDYMEAILEASPYVGGGGITWTTALAYNTDTFPKGSVTSWANFFDLENFPGRRAVWNFWTNNPVFALLAKHPDLINTVEGRSSLSRLTPEQMEEAWQYWEAFKQKAGGDLMFWETGSDCPQLLIAGELSMCSAWNGRIFDAQKEGEPLGIAWEAGHALQTDSWFMPRGLKAQDPETYELANLFIAWCSFPENNAAMAKYITYGPMNMKSLPLLDAPEFDEVRDELPSSPANIPYAVIVDEKWTGEVGDAAQERWMEIQQ